MFVDEPFFYNEPGVVAGLAFFWPLSWVFVAFGGAVWFLFEDLPKRLKNTRHPMLVLHNWAKKPNKIEPVRNYSKLLIATILDSKKDENIPFKQLDP